MPAPGRRNPVAGCGSACRRWWPARSCRIGCRPSCSATRRSRWICRPMISSSMSSVVALTALRIAASLPDSQLVARELASCPRIRSPHRPTWRVMACRVSRRTLRSTRCWGSVLQRRCRPGSCRAARRQREHRGRATPAGGCNAGAVCRRAGGHGHQPVHRTDRAGRPARRSFDPCAARPARRAAALLRAVSACAGAGAESARAGRAPCGALRCTGGRDWLAGKCSDA